jgi:chromate transporter
MMMRSLAPDRERATLAFAAAVIVLVVPSAWGQIIAIVLGGLVGVARLRSDQLSDDAVLPNPVSRRAALLALGLFFPLLIGLPLALTAVPNHSMAMFEAFYRGWRACVWRRACRVAAASICSCPAGLDFG